MASNADFNPRDATLWGDIAQAVITADASGVEVDFGADFYVGTTQTSIAGVWVYSLVIDNSANTDPVLYQLGANTSDGATAVEATCPAGQVREFAPFHTAKGLTLKRGGSSDIPVILTAAYKP